MVSVESAVSSEFDDEAISVRPVMHDRVFDGTPVLRMRTAARDQESRSRRDFEPARPSLCRPRAASIHSLAPAIVCAKRGEPFIQGAGVELIRRGLPACHEDPRREPGLGHADRLVAAEKSADVKSERAVADLERLGASPLAGRGFRAECGVGGA